MSVERYSTMTIKEPNTILPKEINSINADIDGVMSEGQDDVVSMNSAQENINREPHAERNFSENDDINTHLNGEVRVGRAEE